jgi:hypothetical protein
MILVMKLTIMAIMKVKMTPINTGCAGDSENSLLSVHKIYPAKIA